MRILLIDDEVPVTDLLTIYLRQKGHTPRSINWMKGEETLRELLDEFQPNGVILDYEMVPSGLEIFGWVRSWDENTPIVFYTKYSESPPHQKQMKDVGADSIIAKREAARDVLVLLDALRPS